MYKQGPGFSFIEILLSLYFNLFLRPLPTFGFDFKHKKSLLERYDFRF